MRTRFRVAFIFNGLRTHWHLLVFLPEDRGPVGPLTAKIRGYARNRRGRPCACPGRRCPLPALLAERRALAVNGYVFPDRDGKGHLVEPRRQMKHETAESGVAFTVHDLRRTFVTVANIAVSNAYTLSGWSTTRSAAT